MMQKEIVRLALPYYKKGRAGDIEHIKWIQKRLFKLEKAIKRKGYDFDIIYALTILHDVRYSKMPKGYNPFDLKIRKAHAKASAKIAEVVFKKVGFPKKKWKNALYLIEHHDDWAFGKSLKDPEWRIFTDLDMAWEASRKGFDIVRKFLGQSRKEFVVTCRKDYKLKQQKYPFFIEHSRKLFLEDLKYWENKCGR